MDETQLLLSKINDIVNAVKRSRPFGFSAFLNFEQQRLAIDYVKSNRLNYIDYGGYNQGERAVIAVYSDFEPELDDFPIVSLAFKIPSRVQLTHRDILGSLMSLGIKRELVGDIIFFDDVCIFFVLDKIVDYIIQNYVSVKNIKVSPYIFTDSIDFEREFESLDIIVSSNRMDCFVSELAKVSRTKACDLVQSGFVFLNGAQCFKKDKIVTMGDILSIKKVVFLFYLAAKV